MKLHPIRAPRSAARRGTAVLAALVASFVVFALCMGVLQLSSGVTHRQRQAVHQKQAFYMAEVGLAEAYAGLAVQKTGNVGTPDEPATIGNGVFWVEATELDGNLVELESTGLFGTGRVSLSMVVERAPLSISGLGVFASGDLPLEAGVFVDSFDSAKGTYQEQADAGLNAAAVVGSNGGVLLKSDVVLQGDLVHGLGAVAKLHEDATVTGDVGPRQAAEVLPPVEVPDIAGDAAVIVDGPTPYVVPPGEHAFDSLVVRAGSEAVLTGPATLVFAELGAVDQATLTFDDRSGAIDVYVTDRLLLADGAVVQTLEEDPNQLTLQFAGDDTAEAVLAGQARFFGQVYAPAATVELGAGFELFGSLAVGALNAAPLARIHLDLNTEPTREDVLPPMWSWQIVELPTGVDGPGDPFTALGLDQAALPAPAQAHQDQKLELTYVDLGGGTQSYSGMESAFDWTDAQSVVTGTRDGVAFAAIPGASSAAGTAVGNPLDPAEQALVDYMHSGATTTEIKDHLVANSPVGGPVLAELLGLTPAVSSPLVWEVLDANTPLGVATMQLLIDDADYDSAELSLTLVSNSPLAPAVLDAAINRVPPMDPVDLNAVLAAQ
ncbi:MAG: hypothetical protein AAF682_29025 [Planctomycetota bacterium]